MSTVSQNIANVNNPDFAKRAITQTSQTTNGVGQGVSIKSVSRLTDEYLTAALRSQTSELNYTEKLNSYYQQIQVLFGTPDTDSTITSSVDDFFSALKLLSTSPETNALRIDAVNKASKLADTISQLALGLHQTRYQAEHEINDCVGYINEILTQLDVVNQNLVDVGKGSIDTTAIIEERDNLLTTLSEYLDISPYYHANHAVSVIANGGQNLLDPAALYQLYYTPASSVTSMVNNLPLAGLTAHTINTDGSLSAPVNFISAGNSEYGGAPTTVSTSIKSGQLLALEQLRDIDIPAMIDQLDSLAHNITQLINATHNSGSGFPPINSLTGTRPIISNDSRIFEGIASIAVINPDGKPIARPDGVLLKPLNLDLTTLNSGLGYGQPTFQTIIDEINEYFYTEPVSSRASIGNLYNIKMAATSNLSTAPGGTVSFDFELNNESQLNSTFTITGVSVNNGATGLVGGLPANYTSVAGIRARTALPISIDFSGGTGGPYTVQVQAQVTDSNGQISSGTLEFVVDDNPGTLNVMNNRYYATGIINPINASYTSPSSSQRFAKASLVDANGNLISPGSGVAGYLKIAGEQSYCVAMNDLSSKELGLPGTQVTAHAATNKGLASFLELNNLFVRNPLTATDGSGNDSVTGSAVNMAVRADILKNPNHISLGQLQQSPSYVESQTLGDLTATAAVLFNGNPSINDTITLNGTTFTFVAAAAANNEITVGASLATTLNNITAKLSAVNATTQAGVNLATYSNNGLNTLNVLYTIPGSIGNSFHINGNFATVGVSINNGITTTTPSAPLQGGTDKTANVTIVPWSYEVGIGSNTAVNNMANLAYKTLNFNSAGGLPAMSGTLSGYSSAIITNSAVQAVRVDGETQKRTILYDGFKSKIDSIEGINLDEELADTVKYQQAYGASARIIKIAQTLFDTLLGLV
jgi:flagellar hook-associated protein 1 FlgK